MAAGKPYDKAIEVADRAERKQRRRAGDMKKLTRRRQEAARRHEGPRTPMEETRERRQRLDRQSGAWCAACFDIDFTAGGHDYVYEFVPENEVWIDDDIAEAERGYVLVHELHERNG